MRSVNWPELDAEHLVVNSKEMISLEETIISKGLPVESLMEKVGQRMASWLIQNKTMLKNGVFFLIGPGHNGGDGLVIARELYLNGFNVQIWCPIPIKKSLTKKHLSYAKWLGIKQISKTPDIRGKSLWIEALFGLGQTRPLPKALSNLLSEREKYVPKTMICLDVPAGICSETGQTIGEGGGAFASHTLTVGLIKKGLIQDEAIEHTGDLIRIDIGLTRELLGELPKNKFRIIGSEDLSTIPWPKIKANAMKYQRGRALIIAGSNRYPGASILALKGALASGTGSLQAALPESIAKSLWQKFPEILIAGALNSGPSGGLLIAKWLREYDLNKVDSILIGPGIGNTDEPWSLIAESLKGFEGLLVVDADGLNRISMSKDGIRWLKDREHPTWITPHIAEFHRLFPELKNVHPTKAAAKAAQTNNISILLKGAHSLVADQFGTTWQLKKTAQWVARIGLGDLLAGYAAGLGATNKSTTNRKSGELLAISMLLHAEASLISERGSLASSIANSLEELTNSLKRSNCG